MNHLDLFTGIGGFHIAAKRCGIKTIMSSEVDNYCKRLIDVNLGLENCGDISLAVIPREAHPHSKLCENDCVPVEEEGETSLCIEDFMEDILPFPDIVSGGFPCQDISSANTKGCALGIGGERSGLVSEQLRIIEELMPKFAVFENSRHLVSRGLDHILSELDRMGYIVEYGIISAVAFGFPHYRHRTFVVAYLPETEIAKSGVLVFDEVRKIASLKMKKGFILPLLGEDPGKIKKEALTKEPRSIKLRSKRLNGLGNAVVPAIPEAIFSVLAKFESKREHSLHVAPNIAKLPLNKHLVLDGKDWRHPQSSLFCDKGAKTQKLPSHGLVKNGVLYSDGKNDKTLNPNTKAYEGLYLTLLKSDGNNNGGKSRKKRPGGLSGLNGQLGGALNPEWCERFMGYPVGHTELRA